MAFSRVVEVVVGPKGGTGFAIKDLKIAFQIEKTSSVDPNSSKIQIWNLSEDTSKKACVAGNHITLKAGYKDETVAAIFFGDVVKGHRRRDGPDFVTELEVFDGRTSVMSGQVSVSFAVGTTALTVAQAFLDAIGLPYKGTENIPAGAVYDHGHTFIGMAGDGLLELLNRYGLAYTVQNQMLYIIKPGEAADRTGLLLTPKTGLLTTPEPVSDKQSDDDVEADATNLWKFSAMLFPQLLPGAACKVESSTLNGEVIVQKAVFSGDNWDGEFRIDIEAEAA